MENITKIEYFAAKAMQGICVNAGRNGHTFEKPKEIAATAIKIAIETMRAVANEYEHQSNCNLPHVIVSLLSDMPENKPLYKDSGLWQLRTDDMEDVILQQSSDESDNDFIERCKEIQRTKESNEL